ncbi:Uncharacterised protein [Mycobacteroides abscessus subsp. massiliense]|nr:Uncharacterised protein [Mycobacteroides abscessus subsp. massiliense]
MPAPPFFIPLAVTTPSPLDSHARMESLVPVPAPRTMPPAAKPCRDLPHELSLSAPGTWNPNTSEGMEARNVPNTLRGALMTAARPENAEVTASLIALEAPEMPDLSASHPAENLSRMGDTKFQAALIAVLMPSQAGEIALFHSHRAP